MLVLGNKLTLNAQNPIYHFVNKYSIVFDGVDDCIITDGADTVAQPTTYSMWIKSSTTSANYVLGHGHSFYGSFALNQSNKPLLWLEGSYYRYWNDVPQQDDGEWHHWVVYSDTNDITNSKLYCDGVLQTVNSTTTSGNTFAYSESLTIGGTKASGGNYFTGNIDEFAVYDRELTQAEITRMYNTFYSPNRVANGNFSQIGNEEVENGNFSEVGAEEVVNGDFATDSDWTKGTGITISGGSANFTGNANTFLTQSEVVSSGKTYKATFTVSNYVSGAIDINLGGSTRQGNISANGSYVFYITVPSGNILYFQEDFSNGFVGSIDNASVKEVGQDWTFGDGWSVGDGLAECDGTQSTFSFLTQSINLGSKFYEIKFSVTRSAGVLRPQFVGGTSGVESSDIQLSGEYTIYMQSVNNTTFRFRADSSFVGSVTNTSVKEVGQNWGVTGTDLTHYVNFTSSGARFVAGTLSPVTSLFQNVLISGRTYKLTCNIAYESGSGGLRCNIGGVNQAPFTEGFNTRNQVAGSSAFSFLRNEANVNCTISNVVIQELKHDATNLMLNAGAYQSANPLITSTNSMEFDGSDDYLNAGVLPDVFRNAFTVSAWVFTDTSSGSHQILSTGQGAFSQIFQASTSLIIQIKGASTYTKTVANYFATDYQNKWVFLNVVYNGSTVKAYRNGIEVNSDALTGTLNTTTGNFNIGRWIGNSEFWNGKITELGLYDRGLTALEVASLYNQGMPTNLLVNRNDYQSGNPTVFNTKQVDFDGTDDRLVANSTLGSMTGSVSFWFKRDTATRQNILDTRGGSGAGEVYFAGSDLSASVSSGTIYVNGVAGSVNMALNEWHHLVVTGMTLNITEFIAIGCKFNFTYFFNGQMSQVGLWKSTLTANEVSSLYNHGLPVDLNTNQAAYTSSSNLVGYWRMGSGTLDTYPLIADQTNATLGSEQVNNGDYAEAGVGNVISQSGGVFVNDSNRLKITSDTSSGYSRGVWATGGSAGDTFVIEADIISKSGSVRFYDQSNNATYTDVVAGSNYKKYIVLGSSSANLGFGGNNDTSFELILDNVSVKQVNGNPAIMTNMTASDIVNGSPYANIVQNGTFDGSSLGWTESGTWTYGNNNEVCTGNGTNQILTQAGILTSGKFYTYSIDIISSTLSSQEIRVYVGGTDYITHILNSGSETITANTVSAGSNLAIRVNSSNTSGILTIDNVTVAETNTGLQGYWKMGSGINDEYPVIYDQTNPTNGAEIVTNGDFSNGLFDWVVDDGTSWTNVNNTAFCDGNNGLIKQGLTSVLNKIYKVTFDVVNVGSGELSVRIGNGTYATGNYPSGSYVKYLISGGTSQGVLFYATSNWTGSIDNVSVKEVEGNPATMTNMVEGNITNQYPLTKIRNYYRMGDGILDKFPIIQDQTSPNLAHIPTTNLFPYSDNFSQWSLLAGASVISNAIISPDGTQNADEFVFNGTTNGRIEKEIPTTNGLDYTFSIYLKNKNIANPSQIYIGFSQVAQGEFITITNEWKRYLLTVAANGTNEYPRVNSDDAGSLYAWGAQIEQQSQATAYLPSYGVASVRKATTTNLLLYSEDFANATWNKSNIDLLTLTSDIAPNGTSNSVYNFKGDDSNLFTNSQSSSVEYTISFYVKSNGNGKDNFKLRLGSGFSEFTATNEWVRYFYKATPTSQVFGISSNSIDSDVLIWGAQLEQQTQAETYAKTTGLPVTIDLFTENNYGTMTNMTASDIVPDTPNN